MTLFVRNTTILAKLETTNGTEVTPAGSTDAILVRNLTINPLQQDLLERELLRGHMGQFEALSAADWCEMQFEVEAQGRGSAVDTPVAYSSLLQACGLAETVAATVNVSYQPVGTGFKAVTIYAYLNGVLHKAVGAMGDATLELNAASLPVWRFNFTGKYAAASDANPTGTSYANFQAPLPINDGNVGTFTLHSIGKATIPMRGLSLTLGNQVQRRTLVGSQSVLIADRKAAGSVELEAKLLASKNWFSSIQTGATGTLQAQVGSATGKTIIVDAPKVQLMEPSYVAGDDGAWYLRMNLRLLPSAASGNDEFKFTTR